MSVQIDGSTGNIIAIKADYSGDVSIGGTLTYEDVTNIDAVGLITARNGIKVDDLGVQVGTGATIDGATNTLTFLTNGSERVRINSDGLVTVGGNETVSAATGIQIENAGAALLTLLRNDATISDGNTLGGIDFYGNDGGTVQQVAKISAVADGTHGNNDKPTRLIFSTTADGGSSATERLRITSAGDMGLGTASPTARLDVRRDDADGLIAEFHQSSGYGINIKSSQTVATIQAEANQALTFETGSSATERLRIDASGRLMLGTTTEGVADADELTLASGASTGMTIRSSSTGNGNVFFSDTTSGTGEYDGFIQYQHASQALKFGVGATERMRIVSSGQLVIGHSSSIDSAGVQSSLQVTGDNAAKASIGIRRDQNTASGALLILSKSRSGALGNNVAVQSGDQLGAILFNGADGTDVATSAARIKAEVDGTPGSNDMPGRIVFETTADGANSLTERMRIDSSGVVKINQSGTGNIFRIQNTTSDESSMLFQNSTTGYSAGNGLYVGIGGDETSYFWAYQNENLNFGTNNTTRMTIFSGGKLRVPGVYNGTTTGGSAVHVESDGDMLRYTSSLKYKTDVETIEDARADAILNCRPVWYRSKCANDIKTEGSEKSDWGWYGFIAEEVAEIEPRLVNWATKDAVRQEDGLIESVERDPANYEAEGVRYDNFVPLLVNLAKRQQSTIEALEARISALEG